MKSYNSRISHIALAASLCCLGHAQSTATPSDNSTKLVNLDTNSVPAQNSVAARVEFRLAGGDEKHTYTTLQLDAGLGQGLGLVLRSTLSDVNVFNKPNSSLGPAASIEHGGTDLEALLKYACPTLSNLALLGGFAFPNTPAEHGTYLVGEAIYGLPLPMVKVFGGVKGVFKAHSDIAALCAGFEFPLSAGFSIVGDTDWVFNGENTYSTSTGAMARASTYGVAVRYTLSPVKGQLSVDLGISNALGGTTGFSLTPSLGTTPALYAAVSYRY